MSISGRFLYGVVEAGCNSLLTLGLELQLEQHLCSARSELLDWATTGELRPAERGKEISVENEGSYMDKSS